jgi:hypothetical protein
MEAPLSTWDELPLRKKLEQIAKHPGALKDPEVAQQILSLRALLESNPLQFFEPYPKQVSFLESRDFRKAFFGGNRAGKTEIGVVDDLIQAVDRECLPQHLQRFKRWEPPFFCRIISPKYGVSEAVIQQKLRDLCPKDQLVGGSFDKAYNKEFRRLSFKNGSWIQFRTGDQDVDAHAGVKLHRAHFDEEPEGEHGFQVYRENVQRLADFYPNSQLVVTMTPLFGMTWVYDEVYERRNEPGTHVTVASMLDNPHIPAEFVKQELQGLSKEEYAARVDGQFISFHGRVLANFDPSRHVVSPPSQEHVRSLDVVVGIDPGISRAGVSFNGFNGANHVLTFDELYPSGEDGAVPRMAAAIKGKLHAWGIPLQDVVFVIDPSARNRALVNAESVEGEFARQGIYCVPGQNDRLAGVLQMRARLDSLAWKVSSDCVNHLEEIKRWVVAKDELTERDRPKAKGAGGTFATSGPDHLMDPARYVQMHRVWYALAPAPRTEQAERFWEPDKAPNLSRFKGEEPTSDAPLGAMS